MINAKEHLINKYDEDDRIVSMLAVHNDKQDHPLISGFDMLILIVTMDEHTSESILHYIEDGCRIQERWLHANSLEQWMFEADKRNVIQWLLEGDILIDRTGYMMSLRNQLLEFDQELREKKLIMEFGQFLKTYLQSKEYLKQDYLLDAYTNILAALHHWARITVIEAGTHPEVIVWQQVYKINPGVYKLYDELTHSEETLDKRVQLLILACEFAVVSKMKECCAVLLRIIASRSGSWSVMELHNHPKLQGLGLDLSVILKKLVAKSLVKEVVVAHDSKLSAIELQYSAV